MIRSLPTCMWSAFAVLLLTVVLVAAPARASANNDAFFNEFARHVEAADSLSDKARDVISKALAGRDADSDDESLILEALAVMSPQFLAGLDAFDDEDYPATVEKMKPLTDAGDPYVRFYARAYTAKAMVQSDLLVEAEARIQSLLADIDDVRRYTLEEPELRYTLGYCQVQNLEYDAAKQTLEAFLHDFPDASPRFVMTARQMLAEIARRIPEGMGEVADLMSFSQQRLSAGDTDEPVQDAQQRALALLDKMIDQAEQMEQQQQMAAAAPQNQQRRQPGQPQGTPQQSPSQPMPDSRIPNEPPARDAKLPGRQVNPGEAWGAMPDADREKILQVLQDSFPGRYRNLVEQYYESLAKEP